MEAIPFPDDYFDCAICIESFSCYPNPKAALREMKRVLKPESVIPPHMAHVFFLSYILKPWHARSAKRWSSDAGKEC